MKKLSFFLIAVSYFCFFLSWIITKNIYPSKEKLDSSLFSPPLQERIEKDAFTFNKKQNTYTVQPVATYEMTGLIVSQRSDNFLHQYANHDYLNAKDICVLWGRNLTDEIYGNYSFRNNTSACFYEPKSNRNNSHKLILSAFSNNHLIANDPIVENKISEAKQGDQIFLKGYLSNYSTNGGPFRASSVTRQDTGNGACETIFVTDFKILKKSTRLNIWLFSLGTIFLPLGVLIALFCGKNK